MSLVRGVLDRLVLIGGVLAGGCVPGFVAQYQQRVGGRLDQVKLDLAPFQEIARRYHGGDLHKLVEHHLASPDQSFHAEGQAVQNMMDSLARLQGMMEGLSGSIWHQLGYLAGHFDHEIGAATWHSFVPSFNLDVASLAVAAALGFALWLVFHGIWRGLAKLADLIVGGFSRPARY